MDGIDKLIDSVKRIIRKETEAYDTAATVRRIEGKTAWVHIDGGVDETPVKLTINAQPGDNVQVRVSGGKAFLVGNGSAPPTDDRVANYARSIATTAQTTAEDAQEAAEAVTGIATAASVNASTAITLAEGIDDHFWSDSAGAHITEDTQEDYLDDPSAAGGNTLITSAGMAIRHGTTQLAAFTASGAQIGQTGGAHAVTTAKSQKFYSSDGVTLIASFGENETGGKTQIKEIRGAKQASLSYNMSYAIDQNEQVTAEDQDGNSLSIASILSPATIVLSPMAILPDYITFTYFTETTITDYNFSRSNGQYHAQSAFSESNGEAYGVNSHAENSAVASGQNSHAQGLSTIATGNEQTVLGRYNKVSYYPKVSGGTYEMLPHAVILGNGYADDHRSNALTVDWDGNVDIAPGAKYKINGAALAAGDVGAAPATWTLQGSATGGTNTVTIPATANEAYVYMKAGNGEYTAYVYVKGPSITRLEMGGYYVSTSDNGLCNLNVSNNNRTYQIRNARYANIDYKSSAKITVYYR